MRQDKFFGRSAARARREAGVEGRCYEDMCCVANQWEKSTEIVVNKEHARQTRNMRSVANQWTNLFDDAT